MLCTFLMLIAGQGPMPSPASEWAAALADARRLPPHIAKHTRYQTLYATSIEDWEAWRLLLTFHFWSIAQESEPPQLRFVTATLFAVYLPEFGISPQTYGRLTFRDPYFHATLTADGKKPLSDIPSPAPWVGNAEAQNELRELTQSQSPLLRADWFFVETSIQEGRGKPGEGTGYYDFIGVTDRASFQKAVGADPKQADELKRRIRAIVKRSGVAYFPRQIERIDALGGGYWFTLDVLDEGKGSRNAQSQLGKDFSHQAERHYGIGPAGMPWVFLCNEKGESQNSAPDKLGRDTTRPGARQIIDVGASCFRCHKEILRPIDSWINESLKAPVTANVEYGRAIDERRLYFRSLQGKLKRDREDFADRLKECNGLTPAANAEAYTRLWDWYAEKELTIADCARELGCTPKRFTEALTAVRASGKLHPNFTDLLNEDGTILRHQWEESYPLAQTYIGGHKP